MAHLNSLAMSSQQLSVLSGNWLIIINTTRSSSKLFREEITSLKDSLTLLIHGERFWAIIWRKIPPPVAVVEIRSVRMMIYEQKFSYWLDIEDENEGKRNKQHAFQNWEEKIKQCMCQYDTWWNQFKLQFYSPDMKIIIYNTIRLNFIHKIYRLLFQLWSIF